MFVLIVCAIIIPPLLLLIYNYINQLIMLKEYPPGPIPLPIIGNLHQLGERPYKTFMKMKEKYGDVFSVSFGCERVVIINNIKSTREALITRLNAFSGRPKNYSLEIVSRGYISLGLADYGPYYTSIKKLGHSAIKMFGEGNQRIQRIVIEESEYLHKRLKENIGSPVDINSEFGLAVINLMLQLMLGNRYTKDEEEYKLIIRFTDLIFKGLGPSNIVSYFPWMRYLPLNGIKQLKLGVMLRDKFLKKQFHNHKSTYNPNKLRGCLDTFIKVLEEEKDSYNFTNDHIQMLTNDIFNGGTETTAKTLRWAVLYLLHWPHYQDEIYNEIKRNIGPNRYPDMDDRDSLNFTRAFIQEVLRYSTLTPIGVPRKTMENTEVYGYSIPKNTQVLINHWSINYDSNQWEIPEVFNPRRFLNEEGKCVSGSQQSFYPFSAGRRACFGETIARLELFLIFTRFMRDFKLSKPPQEELASLDGILGIVLSPADYKVVFTLRDDHLIPS